MLYPVQNLVALQKLAHFDRDLCTIEVKHNFGILILANQQLIHIWRCVLPMACFLGLTFLVGTLIVVSSFLEQGWSFWMVVLLSGTCLTVEWNAYLLIFSGCGLVFKLNSYFLIVLFWESWRYYSVCFIQIEVWLAVKVCSWMVESAILGCLVFGGNIFWITVSKFSLAVIWFFWPKIQNWLNCKLSSIQRSKTYLLSFSLFWVLNISLPTCFITTPAWTSSFDVYPVLFPSSWLSRWWTPGVLFAVLLLN